MVTRETVKQLSDERLADAITKLKSEVELQAFEISALAEDTEELLDQLHLLEDERDKREDLAAEAEFQPDLFATA